MSKAGLATGQPVLEQREVLPEDDAIFRSERRRHARQLAQPRVVRRSPMQSAR